MKTRYLWTAAFLLGWCVEALAAAAAPSPSLLKAKQEAEGKGYVFFANREEIVTQAKKERRVHVLSAAQDSSLKAIAEAFKKKYPFIDVRWEEVSGTEVYQRMLQEMKAGVAKWDVNYSAPDYYSDYLPHQKKFDLLGMAQHGVLRMVPEMVDPINRHIVAIQSNAQVAVYNKTLFAPDRVPANWEDFLTPEFKDRKFTLNVRPKFFAALVPAWGLEKTLDFARKVAAQNPIWMKADARIITSLLAGEYPLFLGSNYKTFVRMQAKDPKGILGYKALEPIPIRISETEGVLATAGSPHAGLLWLEFIAGPEGQKVLDEVDLSASLFNSDSTHERLTRGKKVSLVGWEHYLRVEGYEEQIVKALGFPRADK
jgi:ABC-type Fe3+ transport system substrate-binding protein